MIIEINHVDLVVSFSWPHSTPQSEFSIKSYGRLKLRWLDFDFDFFFLSQSLISLFIYENR
jgi:hypothetical protein